MNDHNRVSHEAGSARNPPEAAPWIEIISKLPSDDGIDGHVEHVDGPGGVALKFDGSSTCLSRPMPGFSTNDGFTVAAWIALATYPWNRVPIVDRRREELGLPAAGFFFGIDDQGRLVMSLISDDTPIEVTSEPLALRRWYHVAATVAPHGPVEIYVDGRRVASAMLAKPMTDVRTLAVVVGRSRYSQVATGGIRPAAHFPLDIYFDGLMASVRVRAGCLGADAIEADHAAVVPGAVALVQRRLPCGPEGAGVFGAYYTTLRYDEAWDRRWRVGDAADVVVRFDDGGHRFVFWHGTNYVPCWVTAENIWYTNEFNETWGQGLAGCAEPMSDKQCLHSQVRVLESNAVRCVVHWRYALVDVLGRLAHPDPISQWSDWSDEVYTIYPDGVGTRHVTLHSTRALDAHEWQESIVVLNPGQSPEDVINVEAVSMANMAGEEAVYSWAEGCPQALDRPAHANIVRINIKSSKKPFFVVGTGPSMNRDRQVEPGPVYQSYRNEIRREQAMFPWWNHWPTADIPSDGRWAQAADRPAHSSLVMGTEWEDLEATPTRRSRVMLHGLTECSAAGLVPLARAWLQAPESVVRSGHLEPLGFDKLQRLFRFRTVDARATEAELVFAASADRPLQGLAIAVEGWGPADAAVSVAPPNAMDPRRIRTAVTHSLDASTLLLWLPLTASFPVTVRIASR